MDGIFKDGWGDAPLGLYLLKREQWPTEKSLFDPTLHLYLVDTNLNILLAMRQVTMSEGFLEVLRRGISSQMEHPMEGQAFTEAVQKAWSALTSQQMREKASAVQEVPLEIPLRKTLH